MKNSYTVLKLRVNNHPGVMSHITGLFSRRNFNLEGILCGKIGDGSLSIIYLLVNHQQKLEQIIVQLEKLYDVKAVSIADNFDQNRFTVLPCCD